MRIRTEIPAAIVFFKPGEPKTRPLLREINPDHEEALIVAEGNVVAWAVFLDEFAFKQNGFRFAANCVRLKIPRRVEHGARF